MSAYSFLYLLIYLSIGVFSGLISGLLGLGGGVIVVPALAFAFTYIGATNTQHLIMSHPMHTAIGTSLAVMVLTTISSAVSHYKHGSMRTDIWRKWILGLLVGTILGAYISAKLPTMSLRMIFAVFLLVIAAKIFFGNKLLTLKLNMSRLVLIIIGLLIGIFSGLLGVGGGVLMVPLLLAFGCQMNEAAGTAAASTFPLAIVGALTYIILGCVEHNSYMGWMIGYVYLPAFFAIGVMGVCCAPLGVRLAQKISSGGLKRVFAIILFLIGLRMIISLH